MPISAANLVGQVTIDGAESAQSKLSGVGRSVDETQSKLSGGLLSGLKNAAGGFLDFGAKLGQTVIGFQGLAQGAIGLASSLLAPNASMEQTTVAFETLLGKGKQTQAFLQQMKDFAAATPFEFPEVATTAQHMLALGFQAKQVIPLLTNIGDAMGSMGKGAGDIDHIVGIFGQMHAAGKLNAGDMMQLADEGVPAWKMLAAAMGKTVPEVQKLTTAGLIPADKAIQAVSDGMHKMFGGGMAAQANTFNGLMSTLQDNASAAFRAFTGPLFEQAKTGLVQLGNLVSGPQFQQFATVMGERVGGAIKTVEGFIRTNIIPAFNDFVHLLKSPEMGDFVGKLGALGTELLSVVAPALSDTKSQSHDLFGFLQTTAIPALSGLVSGLTQTIKFLKDHGAQVQAVAVILTALYIPALIKTGVESVIAGAKSAGSFVASIVKVGVEGWQAAAKLQLFIGDIVASGARSIIAGAQIAASFVASLVKAGVEAVITGAKIVASFVASMITAGAQAVITGAKIVASFIAGLISAGIEAAVSAGIMLSTLVPALAAVAIEVIAATWPFLLIAAVVAAVVVGIVLAVQHWGQISAWLQGVWAAFSAWFIGAMHTIGAFFTNIWNSLAAFFQGAWSNIVSIARNNAGLILAVVTGPVGLLVYFIISHWQQIVAATQSLGSTIANIFSNMASAAYNAGVSIVSQIVSGIESMIGQAGAAMNHLASEIAAHLPHSPAKKGPLMTIHQTMPAMVKMLTSGIEGGIPAISASIKHLVSPMSDTLQPKSSFSSLGSGSQFGSTIAQASAPTIIVQPAPVYLDGRMLAQGIMPHSVEMIRVATGQHGM